MSETRILSCGRTYDPVADNLRHWKPLGVALASAMAGILFVACSDAKPVGYYLNHAKERADKVQACLGAGSDSADCINARQAQFQALGIPAAGGRALPAN